MVLRVAGKGLPIFRGAGRGDLYVQIGVRIPEAISAEAALRGRYLRRASARRSARTDGPCAPSRSVDTARSPAAVVGRSRTGGAVGGVR